MTINHYTADNMMITHYTADSGARMVFLSEGSMPPGLEQAMKAALAGHPELSEIPEHIQDKAFVYLGFNCEHTYRQVPHSQVPALNRLVARYTLGHATAGKLPRIEP